MGSLQEETDRPKYRPRKKQTERTFEQDMISHFERELSRESHPNRREELQSMLDEWQRFSG
jgi:hypothetical protein